MLAVAIHGGASASVFTAGVAVIVWFTNRYRKSPERRGVQPRPRHAQAGAATGYHSTAVRVSGGACPGCKQPKESDHHCPCGVLLCSRCSQ